MLQQYMAGHVPGVVLVIVAFLNLRQMCFAGEKIGVVIVSDIIIFFRRLARSDRAPKGRS